MRYLQDPGNPPASPVSPVILSKNPFSGLTTKSTNFHEWGTASPGNFFVGFIRKFDSLAPTRLTLRANLRLLYLPPAPALGCGSNERFGAHRDAATTALIETPLQVNQLSVLFVFIRALRGSNVWCLLIQARRDAERFGAHRDAATGESAVGFIRGHKKTGSRF